MKSNPIKAALATDTPLSIPLTLAMSLLCGLSAAILTALYWGATIVVFWFLNGADASQVMLIPFGLFASFWALGWLGGSAYMLHGAILKRPRRDMEFVVSKLLMAFVFSALISFPFLFVFLVGALIVF